MTVDGSVPKTVGTGPGEIGAWARLRRRLAGLLGCALAQDVPELRFERRKRFHQRGGIKLPRDSGWELVCRVIRKMGPVGFSIQHGAAPHVGSASSVGRG